MLRILNILENSENFEKLETDDEIIKQQPAKIHILFVLIHQFTQQQTKKKSGDVREITEQNV